MPEKWVNRLRIVISLLPSWNSGRYCVTRSFSRNLPSSNSFISDDVVATTLVSDARSKMVSTVIGSGVGTTFSTLAGLHSENLPASRLVHYRSFDGRIISAFLWVPFNLQRDGASPGIVLPHGGPTGQTLDSFSRTAEALASRGYVSIAPNVRGSTGYGMAFQKANYKDLGGGDLQDEVYAAKFLVATGYVNEKKIGIIGGSYGGYMAMMAIGKTPDVWAAAVELFGITDWLTEQAHESPELQQYDQSILGDPVKDRKVYEDASPIKYFQNAKAPLLVLQGENDI